jgi:hypothetical protein
LAANNTTTSYFFYALALIFLLLATTTGISAGYRVVLWLRRAEIARHHVVRFSLSSHHGSLPAARSKRHDDLVPPRIGALRLDLSEVAIRLEQPQHAVYVRQVGPVLFQLAFQLLDPMRMVSSSLLPFAGAS